MPWGVKEAPASAWEDNRKRSNDIIILGKRYELVKSGDMRVINFVDNPKLDFRKVPELIARQQIPVMDRPGRPKNMEDLKKAIDYCVIHTDMTTNAYKTFLALYKKPLDQIPLSSHFCINWNGDIYQYADVASVTFHAGNANPRSIGIDMNGMLVGLHNNSPKSRDRLRRFKELQITYRALVKEKLTEKFKGQLSKEQLKRKMDDYEFQQARSMKLRGRTLRSHGYTERQYQSLIALLRLFVRELDLEKTYPMQEGGKPLPFTIESPDELKKLKGFVGHWHVANTRSDPGPGFDWEKVLAGILNESNSFPVAWKDEHRIRGARDKDRVEHAAYELARNPETARRGGTFPMGPNQTWHGGIHLYPPPLENENERRIVRAMFDGVIVAGHFEPNSRELGHNNFVLLRHDIEIPKRKAKLNEDGTLQTTKLRVFSLYMHLAPMNVSAENADKLADSEVPWVQRLRDWGNLKDNAQALQEAIGKFEKEEKERRKEEQDRLESGEEIEDLEGNRTVFLDEDEMASQEANPVPVLQVGGGYKALRNPNQVAILLSDDLEVKVLAGEGLGFVGETVGTDEEDRSPTVHVEVFCSQQAIQELDLDAHARYFRTPQRARGSDLTVRTQDILALFGERDVAPYGAIQVWPEHRLEPDTVLDFFAGSAENKVDEMEQYRSQLRKSITYHVSEWSDQVDWVATLTGGEPWGAALQQSQFQDIVKQRGLFSNEIRKFLPFIWLTEDVAGKIGLMEEGDEWDGRVYHFHPIWFLMWVTYHASKRKIRSWTRMSYREIVRRRKRQKKILEIVKKARNNEKFMLHKLDKALSHKGFYLDRKSRKPGDEAFEELRNEILARIRGELAGDEDESHGIVADVEPVFSTPKEVLQDLFELPGRSEWRRYDEDDEEA
jgi:N-acetyl-anhydromuramyl-L-alanine amidase AmpD